MPTVTPEGTSRRDRSSAPFVWIVTGVCLLAYAVASASLSRRVASNGLSIEDAADRLVVLSIVAGLVYLVGLLWVARRPASRRTLWTLIAFGVAMRGVLIAAPPLLENDYYRYLWDGAVTTRGHDPYRYPPRQILWASVGADSAPDELVELANDPGSVIERINHPHLTTIYPPVAQVAFALTAWIAPWNTYVWRLLLLVADVITLVIVLRFLRSFRLSAGLAAWYWWNPILLRETFGAAHMDVLVLPIVMAAILLAERRRLAWASLLLALAGGVKLWPMILLPVVLRPVLGTPSRLIKPLAVFVVTMVIVWAPTLPAAYGPDSGFLAYAAGWRNNDGAFRLIESFWIRALPLIADDPARLVQLLSRLVVGAALLGWIGRQTWRPIAGRGDVSNRCLLIIAALFLLSPTQFPWYYLWLLPMLAVAPRASLLLYSALLPLYYVQQQYDGLIWLEHVPVWTWLAWECWGKANPAPRPDRAAGPDDRETSCPYVP